MMIKYITRFFVLAFALVAFVAPQAQADTPIGVIDLTKIIETSAAGKDLSTKYKTRKEAVQKEAMAFEKDVKDKEATLTKERKTLDEKAFNEKKATFEKDLKKKREDILTKNVNLEKAKNTSLRTVQTKVIQIAEGVAKEKNIQVILDRTAIVIAQDPLNITDEVIKKLDAELKTVELK